MKYICFTAALGVALIGLAPMPASADSYPSRSVSIVVPYPPGGSVDGVARIIARHRRPIHPADKAPLC